MNLLKIDNLVVKFDCMVKIDLNKLNKILPNSEYDPELYFALINRRKEPKTSFLINSSGVIIINGLKNVRDINSSAKYIVDKLKDVGYNAKYNSNKIEIVNIIAGYNLKKKIDLDKLSLLEHTKYNPKQFPGLILKLDKGKALIFSSGKTQLVGFKSEKEIFNAVQTIKKIKGM